MCAASSSPGYPDLYHPLQYKKREALWKRDLNLKHREFCACGNFLLHFKWPSTGGEGGDTGGQDGGTGEEDSTKEDMEGITGTDVEDPIPDSALLQ
nr:ORF2 [Torque teno Leptonychotes weddellii virus 1]